jgi:predicted aminopeptidase
MATAIRSPQRAARDTASSLARCVNRAAWSRPILIAVLCLTTTGCYYIQAARGQISLMMAREPIDEMLADPDLAPHLREGLERVALARVFAIDELGLPDNGSYRHLVQLEGERVAWNVFAAAELSLAPREWCLPIAGCMAYRSYFSHDAAVRYSERLTEDGWDTHVAPVAAYSTLGRFRDPVLDAMFAWPEPELAGLIFHELAHQQLYLLDDTAFNESFATAVEEIGLRRWLQVHPLSGEQLAAYHGRRSREAEFNQLLAETRFVLETIYASEADEDARRAAKAQAFDALRFRYETLRDEGWQGYDGYDNWFERPLNNARLLPVITYRSWLDAFVALYAEVGEDLPGFFEAAEVIANLDTAPRIERLEALDAKQQERSD